MGGGIDGQRFDPRLSGECAQPAANAFPLPRPVDHVENHNHRLPRGRSGSKKITHRSVVVFLLGEHRDQNIAGIAHQFSPVPVLPQRAVDVGSVEEDEPGRLPTAGILAPHQQVIPLCPPSE